MTASRLLDPLSPAYWKIDLLLHFLAADGCAQQKFALHNTIGQQVCAPLYITWEALRRLTAGLFLTRLDHWCFSDSLALASSVAPPPKTLCRAEIYLG